MTTHTLPPIDPTGQLSQRAVQMLRDLKGMSVLNGNVPTLSETVDMSSRGPKAAYMSKAMPAEDLRVEPSLGASKAFSSGASVSKGKGDGSGSGFSRDAYLRDVRGSLFGSVVISLIMLIFVLAGLFVLGKDVLLPEFAVLKQKQATVMDLPMALKTVDAQLQLQKQKLEAIVERSSKLTQYFPDSQELEASYVDFLNLLESQKISVIEQASSVTQASNNPLYASVKAAGDGKPAVAPQGGKPKNINLSGAVTTGLNYYHIELSLQGSYVGYLAARQALVNANPNVIVHAETIQASPSKAGQMDMVVFASLPFLSQP